MRFALDDGFFSPLNTSETIPSIYDACRRVANSHMPDARCLETDIEELLNAETAPPILFAPISTAQSRFELRPAPDEAGSHPPEHEDVQSVHDHADWLRYTVRRMRRQ